MLPVVNPPCTQAPRTQSRAPQQVPLATKPQAALRKVIAHAMSSHTSQHQQQAGTQPLLVGLTGSIGMGKSTVAGLLRARGVPVQCADEVVHTLYAAGGAAVAPVGAAFPSAVAADGSIDRAALSRCVVGNDAAMKQLEGIVHPLVEAARASFTQEHAAAGALLVVFDIPLLYETKAEAQLDAVLVVSAPPDVQRERVLARPGMTPEKLEAILGRQVSDEEKRRRADYVIDTGCSLEETEQQVASILQKLVDSRE